MLGHIEIIRVQSGLSRSETIRRLIQLGLATSIFPATASGTATDKIELYVPIEFRNDIDQFAKASNMSRSKAVKELIHRGLIARAEEIRRPRTPHSRRWRVR